jgi:hypothetical protein
MKLAQRVSIVVCMVLSAVPVLAVQQDEWLAVPCITHSEYQSVHTDGSSAFDNEFWIRLRGVVLNNTEDWLDPTPDYDPGYTAWYMGGEAEFYVQAVNLDNTQYDTDTDNPFNDFGGTACWMGQNYGNHVKRGNSAYSYENDEWLAELARLNLYGGVNVDNPIRAGDLVEIRARIGLHYKGKMNVNEDHNNDPNYNFEIVVLEENYGLPTPTAISLSDIKDENDVAIFDETRQTGGEKYQSTLVELQDVWVTSDVYLTTDTDIEVTDGTRTFNVHLGLNDSFDGTTLLTTNDHFNAVGILDQAASNGVYSTDGYQLLVMNAGDITPEPASMMLLAMGALPLLRRRK